MVNLRRETTISGRRILISTRRNRPWLAAVGIVLALLVQTGAALEIGHTTVNSKLGEPLDATVRVIPGPEERIDATCLSLVRKAGPAETGHVLINDVALSQESGSGSIHITTANR